jgi:hypothetical protein
MNTSSIKHMIGDAAPASQRQRTNNRTIPWPLRSTAVVVFAALAVAVPAFAHGAGGGGHGGGGGHAGGFHSGGGRGSSRGFHSGYGYRGGYGYGGWGWGGLGYGLFFAALPLYYSTLWWNGMPYYYADDNYYQWNDSVGEYQTVNPPPQIANQVAPQQNVTDLFVYPKNSQNLEQQALDKRDCHRWAAAQSGFDPTQPGDVPATVSTPAAGAVPAATVEAPINRQDYLRAQAACLEARGYSVK